ncbi:hypothetical protein FOZ63_002190 [Perkinsus olseni]|uniref:CCHC-type domain-containing protein n=1 Tax=Perkinsus olseni TaxID=32597 RepID=A0A7J6TC27_PEROL|nr:hypothetical protein FOZ63_002190 [Perkinsus olseni]
MPPRVAKKAAGVNAGSQGSNIANRSAIGGEPGQGNEGNSHANPAANPNDQLLGAEFEALHAFVLAHQLEEADLWYLDDNDLSDLILKVQLRRYRTAKAPPPIVTFGNSDDPIGHPDERWFSPLSTTQRQSAHGTPSATGTPAPTFGGTPAPTFAAPNDGLPQGLHPSNVADPYVYPPDDVASQAFRSSLGDHLHHVSPPPPGSVDSGTLYRGLSALSKCLDPSTYKQLNKHIRRVGLSTDDPLHKLQEADRFLPARYKTTNNDGKFVARIDALKMEKLETPTSFVDRLRAVLDEGFDIGIHRTPYQEKQLFIRGLTAHYREQACSVWPNVSNINELAELLTDWDAQRKRYSHAVSGNLLTTGEDLSTPPPTEHFGNSQVVQSDNNKMTTTTSNIRKGNCYRCNKPGHRAGVCRSQNVYQLTKRCGKCGDFSHSIADCMRTLLSPCSRCRKPGHIGWRMYRASCEPSIDYIYHGAKQYRFGS